MLSHYFYSMSNQVALILGASTLATLHLQGCSDSDDDKGYTTSTDCNPNGDVTINNVSQIIALGDPDSPESKALPDCATCVAGRLNGTNLNGNGYCAQSGSTINGYPSCDRANAKSAVKNGFPITTAIALGELPSWPNNLNGVVEAFANCGADLDTDSLETLLPQPDAPTCIGLSSGPGKPGNFEDYDETVGCGRCIFNQLQANGCDAANPDGDGCIDLGDFSFGTPSTWPSNADLKRAYSGSSSADPSKSFPGCGGTWEFTD